jgi:hypothetical protein
VLYRDVRFHFCASGSIRGADEVDELFIRFKPATILRKEREYGGQVVPGIPGEEYPPRPRVRQPHIRRTWPARTIFSAKKAGVVRFIVDAYSW